MSTTTTYIFHFHFFFLHAHHTPYINIKSVLLTMHITEMLTLCSVSYVQHKLHLYYWWTLHSGYFFYYIQPYTQGASIHRTLQGPAI